VLVVMLVLVLDGGGGPGSFHRFDFIRLFQGKAIFVTVMLPLLFAYGVRFGTRPTAGRFVLLMAVQVAALGTTVTALWAAPAAALLAVVSMLRVRTASLATLGAAFLSCSYVLAWGLYLKFTMGGAATPEVTPSDALNNPALEAQLAAAPGAEPLAHAYRMVLGHSTHLATALAVAMLAWTACRSERARRFAVVMPLGFFALLGNPWVLRFVSSLTTPTIYWRVVWLLPVPVLTALLLTSLLRPGFGLSRRSGVVLFSAATLLFVGWQSIRRPTLLRAAFGPPTVKVDRQAYRVARALNRSVGSRRQVLAPPRVSLVLAMLNDSSYPLATKGRFVPVSVEERTTRVQLGRIVDQTGPSLDATWFVQKLNDFRVEGVALVQGRRRGRLARTLSGAGFKQADAIAGHEIWIRRLPAP
jgi:hypothetical protein